MDHSAVHINRPAPRRSPPPRRSARHRPDLASHWGSKYGIEEFLEVKYLCMGGIDR